MLLETTDHAAGGPELDLSAADTRAIATMIEDLKLLTAAGITQLRIQREDTFLQSLTDAVSNAKGRMP